MTAIVALAIGGATVACERARVPFEEFATHGEIQGVFRLGSRTLKEGWVELIQLSGPPEERCGPGDCGVAVDALAKGALWPAGRWRVVPPPVEGWEEPPPLEVVVVTDEATSFELTYAR